MVLDRHPTHPITCETAFCAFRGGSPKPDGNPQGAATFPSPSGAAHLAFDVAFDVAYRLGLCEFRISQLNKPPHTIAMYASQPPSPTTTQYSLAGARYGLPAPIFHSAGSRQRSGRTSNPAARPETGVIR